MLHDVSQCMFNCFYYGTLLQIHEKGIWIVHCLVAELRELMLQYCIALKIVRCKWSRFNSALNAVVILKHYCQWEQLLQRVTKFELFYIGMPVVRTKSVGRSVYGHVVTKFSRMGRLLHFLTYGVPMARFAGESSAINFSLSCNLSFLFILHDIRSHSHLFTDVPRFNCILPICICEYNVH